MPGPDIFLFNPTCDFAIANKTASWKPNLLLQTMERDLTNLPQFLCQQNDIVLVHEIPSEQLLKNLHLAGFTIPRFKTITESLSDQIFISEPISHLRPWGWSPAAHNLLKHHAVKLFINRPSATGTNSNAGFSAAQQHSVF